MINHLRTWLFVSILYLCVINIPFLFSLDADYLFLVLMFLTPFVIAAYSYFINHKRDKKVDVLFISIILFLIFYCLQFLLSPYIENASLLTLNKVGLYPYEGYSQSNPIWVNYLLYINEMVFDNIILGIVCFIFIFVTPIIIFEKIFRHFYNRKRQEHVVDKNYAIQSKRTKAQNFFGIFIIGMFILSAYLEKDLNMASSVLFIIVFIVGLIFVSRISK